MQAIVQGIEATEVIPGRCELIDEDQDFGVVIDSADTPESLSRLLDSIKETAPRRIILVFGCEGERDQDARPFMGEIAHWKVDSLEADFKVDVGCPMMQDVFTFHCLCPSKLDIQLYGCLLRP